MDRDEIKENIINSVGVFSTASNVTESSRFREELNFDSLDNIEMLLEVEEVFNIEVRDEEADKIFTVGEAIDFVEERLMCKKSTKTKN